MYSLSFTTAPRQSAFFRSLFILLGDKSTESRFSFIREQIPLDPNPLEQTIPGIFKKIGLRFPRVVPHFFIKSERLLGRFFPRKLLRCLKSSLPKPLPQFGIVANRQNRPRKFTFIRFGRQHHPIFTIFYDFAHTRSIERNNRQPRRHRLGKNQSLSLAKRGKYKKIHRLVGIPKILTGFLSGKTDPLRQTAIGEKPFHRPFERTGADSQKNCPGSRYESFGNGVAKITEVLFLSHATECSDHKRLFFNSFRTTKTLPIPARKFCQIDPRRNHRDRFLHPALTDQIRNALARRNDSVR